jgi:hypothetical protein
MYFRSIINLMLVSLTPHKIIIPLIFKPKGCQDFSHVIFWIGKDIRRRERRKGIPTDRVEIGRSL